MRRTITLFQLENNQTMDNNNYDRNQNSDRFPSNEDGKLEYHWGSHDNVMRIIKRRDTSPEARDLVEKGIALTNPETCATTTRKNWKDKF